MHGLRGHPQRTWEASRVAKDESRTAASNRRNLFQTVFRRPHTQRTASRHVEKDGYNNDNEHIRSDDVFWPRDYLARDIPEARVWAYGYNADVIGGMFQADNQNSVSQHGRDLVQHFKRDLENEVRSHPRTYQKFRKLIVVGVPGTNYSRGAQPRRCYCERCMPLFPV